MNGERAGQPRRVVVGNQEITTASAARDPAAMREMFAARRREREQLGQ